MKKLALTFMILLATAGMAFAQSDLQVLSVVKYNKSESITVKQVKARCGVYEKQYGQKLTVEQRKTVLNSLIEEKLILQAAAKAGISIPDSAVDQYFQQSMAQSTGLNVSEKELSDYIKQAQGITLDQLLQQQTGMNIAEYKLYLKNQLIAQQYVVSQRQEEIMKQVATDEEIRAFYQNKKSEYVWTDMAKLFMVIVPKGSDPDGAKTKITDLRNKYVEKKMSGDQIAAQSRMENSGYQAGEMLIPITEVGAQGLGMTYSSLLDLFNSPEGYIDEVVDVSTSYLFVAIQKKYDAKLLSLSDVVSPDSTVTVYEFIRNALSQQKQMAYLQRAAQEIATDLHKPGNVEDKKIGADLEKLLNWGE
ncbi:MAG: SurA N-terminal domain-containing protein [Treponema sp.]|nr:SurA N-terminal domain-containing protein [Treponema sp.]